MSSWRELFRLDNYTIDEIIDLGDEVFEDATVPGIIFMFSEKRSDETIKIGSFESIVGIKPYRQIEQNYYYQTPKYSFNLYADENFIKLQKTIDHTTVFRLKEVAEIKIGVCTGSNKKHVAKEPLFENSKRVLLGRDINRYRLLFDNNYLNYDRKALLRARDEQIFLKEEKLLMRQTSDRLILTYDNNQFYTIDSLFILYILDSRVNLKYLLTLMNSKLLNRQYQRLNPETNRVFAQVKIDYVYELPIKIVSGERQKSFVEKADRMLELNQQFQKNSIKFLRFIETSYAPKKLSNKLRQFYSLAFSDFAKELEKQKVSLTKKDEFELMELFDEQKASITDIQHAINETDEDINKMVYELYGLTDEEIQIIAAS